MKRVVSWSCIVMFSLVFLEPNYAQERESVIRFQHLTSFWEDHDTKMSYLKTNPQGLYLEVMALKDGNLSVGSSHSNPSLEKHEGYFDFSSNHWCLAIYDSGTPIELCGFKYKSYGEKEIDTPRLYVGTVDELGSAINWPPVGKEAVRESKWQRIALETNVESWKPVSLAGQCLKPVKGKVILIVYESGDAQNVPVTDIRVVRHGK